MDNNLTKAETALINAYSDHTGNEPQYTKEYLDEALESLFMEYNDPENDEPTEMDWARQFVEEGHFQTESGEVLDSSYPIDYDAVVDYINLNYATYGPFMFIAD